MIRNLIFNDLGTKLTALLLAGLTWVYLYMATTDKIIVEDVLMEFEYDRDQLVLLNDQELPGRISVELTAPKGILGPVDLKRVKCMHRIVRTEPGQYTETVTQKSFTGLPKDVTAVILPSNQFAVRLGSRRPYRREVIMDVFQNLPAGFPYTLEIEPREVKVALEGPQSVVEEVKDPAQILRVFITWDRRLELAVGKSTSLPLEVHLIDKNYEGKVVVTPLDRVVQVKVKDRSSSPR